MSSILDLKSDCSDSEDDVDYVPPANAVASDESEDEISDDETEFSESPKSKKAKLDTNGVKNIEVPSDKKTDDEIWKSWLKGVETTSYGKKPSISPNSQSQPQEKEKRISEVTSEQKELTSDKSNLDEDVNKSAVQEKSTESESKSEGNEIGDKQPNKSSENPQPSQEIKKTNPLETKVCPPRTGLSSILGTITGKGKKPTVLEKSLQDWKSFKEEEGIDKDLETFNKGRQGFIERQRFLQRSDLRAFETEKSARLFGKRK